MNDFYHENRGKPWKWVDAIILGHCFLERNSSSTATNKPMPSVANVPLPNSSNKINDWGELFFKANEAAWISKRKEDVSGTSLECKQVKIASVNPITAEEAGTKHPKCA